MKLVGLSKEGGKGAKFAMGAGAGRCTERERGRDMCEESEERTRCGEGEGKNPRKVEREERETEREERESKKRIMEGEVRQREKKGKAKGRRKKANHPRFRRFDGIKPPPFPFFLFLSFYFFSPFHLITTFSSNLPKSNHPISFISQIIIIIIITNYSNNIFIKK